jgi:hypothetical protein
MSEQQVNPIAQAVKTAGNPLSNYFRQPKIFIRLPSQGRFYPEGSLDHSAIDEYPVFAMTAKDELMFKTPDALMNGQATVSVIKSCIPAIKDPWQMPSLDLDACLVAIRIATYGDNMDVTSTCPNCQTLNDFVMSLLGYLDTVSQFVYEDTLQIGPLTIKIRPYSYREVSKTAIKTLEQQKIFAVVNDENMSDEEKLERFGSSFLKLTEMTVDVICGCIESITTPEGTVSDTDIIKNFIENTTSEIFNTIKDHVDHMKEVMKMQSQQVKCSNCGHEWSVNLELDQTNFFAKGS